MSQKIIYKQSNGQVAVVIPTDEALAEHTIQEIAEKDVPSGVSYKIVSDDDIPSDRTFRNAWEVSDSELTDGTGGVYDMFITDPAHPNYVEPNND